METTNLNKTIKEIFNDKYIIPLYQRNYAWGQEHIEQLIQDIYEAHTKNPNGNYYIGSLVVLRRHNGDFEVIDGQQRLTTLSLLTKTLGITNIPVLSYESRPEVEEFFAEFYQSQNATWKTEKPQTHYLREAVECIKSTNIFTETNEITFDKWSGEIKDYLENNVILVRVEIPEDIDVANYFEIMNNRGEQLQKHEIFKAVLMGGLEAKYHDEFSLIWDACSNMDLPIQSSFNANDRKKYFGDNYDEFLFDKLTDEQTISPSLSRNHFTISQIVGNQLSEESNNPIVEEEDGRQYKSIIDFPNFLMHILKLYYNQSNIKKDIQLNEKFLLEYIYDIEEPMEFLYILFKCRTLFDRYIIRTKDAQQKQNEFDWVLCRPQKYDNGTFKYVNTFEKDFDNEREAGRDIQSYLIQLQSMLQVTFRQRIYKNWLQSVLQYLYEKTSETQNIQRLDGLEYIKHLNKWALEYYNNNIKLNNEETPYSMGVNTPHFLLNFIDYLYWVRKFYNKDDIDINQFKFRYWNSVEHHLAVNYAKKQDNEINIKNIDCLGNLFLISRNANSRLSDRSVKDKVEMSKDRNMGANRQIIYKKTRDNNWEWWDREIINHYKELADMLSNREKILEIQSNSTK